MPSVVPRTNTISRVSAAFTNARTFSRACSYASVASTESWWTPRWMFPYERRYMSLAAWMTDSGFCVVAALSR
jgi:hypothetical protein